MPISTLPLPPVEEFGPRGGRYGSHNLHENQPGAFRSSSLIFGTYFNGGVRVHDITDPYRPEEVAYYVPATPEGSAPAPCRSTMSSSTRTGWSTPSTASPAASTSWSSSCEIPGRRRPQCRVP